MTEQDQKKLGDTLWAIADQLPDLFFVAPCGATNHQQQEVLTDGSYSKNSNGSKWRSSFPIAQAVLGAGGRDHRAPRAGANHAAYRVQEKFSRLLEALRQTGADRPRARRMASSGE